MNTYKSCITGDWLSKELTEKANIINVNNTLHYTLQEISLAGELFQQPANPMSLYMAYPNIHENQYQ